MNFLRNRTLAFQLSFVLATLAVLFVAEFLVIRWNFRSLEKMHYQRDLARKTQLLGQQVFLDAVAGTQDPSTLSRTITSKLEEQDYAVREVSDGGCIAETSMLVGKLQDLPHVSSEELKERLLVFKQRAERIAAANNNLNVQKE